jgi:hypothetical protein
MHPLVATSSGIAAGAAVGVGLIVLVRLVVRSSRKPKQSMQTSFLYSGNLKQTSLVDALQLLEIGKREGILHIYHGRRKGYIGFLKGAVIDAFYRNATGREAIFAMMMLTEGDFYFESKEIKQPRLITDSAMDLVMMFEAYKFQQFTANDPGAQPPPDNAPLLQ